MDGADHFSEVLFLKLNELKEKLAQRLSALLKNKHKRETPCPTDGDIWELTAPSSPGSKAFLRSLDDITQDDLAPAPPKKQLSLSDMAFGLIRRAVALACICVFIYSGFTLIRSFVDYKRGDELYSSIADSIFDGNLGGQHAVSMALSARQSVPMPDYYTGLSSDSSELDEELSGGSYNVKFEQMKANLNYLKTVNPDIYGYIYIPDTSISLPIVQSDDNDYYLDHAYTGEYMACGSIFADWKASSIITDNRNTVLYGHNMNNGTMFNNVTKFLDEDFFLNTNIEIYTFDGIYTYEPFAIFETISTYKYFRMKFDGDADFVSFCEEMQNKSLYNRNIEFTGKDRIITLSTCTNSFTSVGRYALHARLIKVEK